VALSGSRRRTARSGKGARGWRGSARGAAATAAASGDGSSVSISSGARENRVGRREGREQCVYATLPVVHEVGVRYRLPIANGVGMRYT
jgi:hypothetical protein